MKVRVLNETTALLRVERMNVSSPHLSCEIEPPGASGPRERKAVCGNEIDVGCECRIFQDLSHTLIDDV